jgi:hypothetical protein
MSKTLYHSVRWGKLPTILNKKRFCGKCNLTEFATVLRFFPRLVDIDQFHTLAHLKRVLDIFSSIRRHLFDAMPLMQSRLALRIDAVSFSQHPFALATMRYRSTDCLKCRGATLTILAYRAGFHSTVKIVPSNAGTDS